MVGEENSMKAKLYFLGILTILSINSQSVCGAQEQAQPSRDNAHIAAGKCLKLIQISHTLGTQTVYVNSRALKVCGENKHVLYAQAPDWQVRFANLETKRYYECPAEKYQSKQASYLKKYVGPMYSGYLLKNGKPANILGLPVICYALVRKPDSRDDFDFKIENGSYCITSEPKLDKRIALILAKLYSIPVTQGLPVKLIRCGKKKELLFELNTPKVSQVPCKASDFEMPEGLTRCKTIEEIYEDKNKLNSIQELFKD